MGLYWCKIILTNITLLMNNLNKKPDSSGFFFCSMILIDITFKWEFDYEMCPGV
jgi:hypothetical protein